MRVLSDVGAAEELAKALEKPVLYLTYTTPENCIDPLREILRAAPYLVVSDLMVEEGAVFVVCDDQDELYKLYDSTVGDDGPTRLNSYEGPGNVYALAINAEGKPETENT